MMKTAHVLGLIGSILLLAGTAGAGVTTIRHTLDYTDNEHLAEPWFIPPDIIRDHSPYYRGMWEDWGWTHDIRHRVPSDAKGILSATLTINAWDVDNTDPEGDEIDIIYANGVRIGQLEPTNGRVWKTTQFTLPREVLDKLWADGKVYIFMNIDSINDMVGHRVTLEYSTLTVNYNVTGSGTPSRLSVHRFWCEAISSYLYTAKTKEKDKLIKNAAGVWVYQGVEYQALPADFEDGSAPVYRFWSDTLRTHYYTIDVAERNKLIYEASATWVYEGEAFWAFPPNNRMSGTIPVYRFWSDAIKRHFYTTNEEQKDKLIAENWDVWTYQGVAWYAYPYETAQ